jgi:hypothetical protein
MPLKTYNVNRTVRTRGLTEGIFFSTNSFRNKEGTTD